MSFKMSGFDELERKLKDLQQNADRIGREGLSLPLNQLLTPLFMRSHTPWSSVDALFEAGGFGEKDIDSPALDAFIADHSRYGSWSVLLSAGSDESPSLQALLRKKLGL